MNHTFTPSKNTDKSTLADIRVNAMKPSLQALGRFDPVRVRNRLLDDFDPNTTFNIMVNQQIVGFFTLITKNDDLWLKHLYIAPEGQGQGLGKAVIKHIKNTATNQSKPLKLQALRGSPANVFYQNHGFVETHQTEWDIFYIWQTNQQKKAEL